MKKFRFAILGQVILQGSFVMLYRELMDARYVQLPVKVLREQKILQKRMVLKAIMMITRHYWRRKDQIVPILQ